MVVIEGFGTCLVPIFVDSVVVRSVVVRRRRRAARSEMTVDRSASVRQSEVAPEST
jgi:hypothetical protein